MKTRQSNVNVISRRFFNFKVNFWNRHFKYEKTPENSPEEEAALKGKSMAENWKVGIRLQSVPEDVEQPVPESVS